MIRPLNLTIRCFRGWRGEVRLPLDRPLTAVVGENGQGKSSLLNAIEWCLFGAEVEKKGKGAGLPERAEWEVRPRQATDEPTEVTLTLDTPEGEVQVRRRRAADAKSRQPDDVAVTHVGGASEAGDRAIAALEALGLPDWETWRRAHCFHQEAARTRVTDTGDRSVLLSSLLGLEEDLRVRVELEAQTRTPLVAKVDEIRGALEQSLVDRLARPRQDLHALEATLAQRGVDRAKLGPDLARAMRGDLLRHARALAGRLEIRCDFPAPDDAAAVDAWSRTWPQVARGPSPALARLEGLRTAYGKVRSALALAEPATKAWRDASAKLRRAVEQGGDADARRETLAARERAETEAHAALQRTNALVALLSDARRVVADGDATVACPVCATSVTGLPARIDAALAAQRGAEETARTAALTQARRDLEKARRAVEELSQLERAAKTAQHSHEEARRGLAAALGLETSDPSHDLLAAARTRLETLGEEGAALRDVQQLLEEALTLHVDEADVLRDVVRWEQLRDRAEQVVDLDALPSARTFERAVDDAAGFSSDLEAVSTMARQAQEARSAERAAAVNETLAGYFALITGRTDHGSLAIQVKRTARTFTYGLVDGRGNAAVPVMNQASLNALSLAMLFAQAEERARAGGLALVVLDDPVQSLDEVHQIGLARAVERLAAASEVLVGTVPSAFAERLETHVATPRRLVRLGPWDAADGAAIAEVLVP